LRHFRSILYALVLAPAVWVLAGVGLTHDLATRGRNDFAVESITGLLLLVLGGAAYAILVFAPISPAGPMVAGLAFLGVSVWALEAPSAYAGIWPGSVAKEGFDLSRPGYGLAALLAVPLICTALSARRWERYEPPVLPIIGRIGRARGAAAVAGTPIAAVETAQLPGRGSDPDATTLLPGRTTDPDPTTVLRLPVRSDSTTTVIRSGDDTTVIRSAGVPDEATVSLNDADPTIPVDSQETAVVLSGDESPTEAVTEAVATDSAEPPSGKPAEALPSQEAASQEAASQEAASQEAASQEAASQEAASQEAASQEAASQEAASQEADEAPTEQGETVEPPTAETAAGEEPTAQAEAAADEPATTEVDQTVAGPKAAEEVVRRPIPLPRAVPAEERTRDLSDRVDPERTQIIRLPVADQGEQTQAVRLPGEQTRVIPFPGGGEDTEVIRLPVRPDDQDNTQVIRPVGEPPDRTDVIKFPVRNGAKEDRQPSIADAEAPNIADDPTSPIVPPEPRRDEGAAKRSMTVMNMERPPDNE
jgi:hypothetical protein